MWKPSSCYVKWELEAVMGGGTSLLVTQDAGASMLKSVPAVCHRGCFTATRGAGEVTWRGDGCPRCWAGCPCLAGQRGAGLAGTPGPGRGCRCRQRGPGAAAVRTGSAAPSSPHGGLQQLITRALRGAWQAAERGNACGTGWEQRWGGW